MKLFKLLIILTVLLCVNVSNAQNFEINPFTGKLDANDPATGVTESGAATLTNKTIDADNNTISNLEHGAEVDNPTAAHGATGAVVGTTNSQTLTNKTLTAPIIDKITFPLDTQTIATGIVTPTNTHTIIAAETGTSDNFDGLNHTNCPDGTIIYMWADTGDTITIKHNQAVGEGESNFITLSTTNITMSESVPSVFQRRGNSFYEQHTSSDLHLDTKFRVLDSADTTKLLHFELGNLTTGTNREITMPDANVDLADVNDLPVANLADGTDGELITWDATGAPATVGAGTAGQVLTSNGAGSAPTMQDASSGGKVLQVVNYTTGAVATGTTLIPNDDTIPQITEGDEYMTLAITPNSTSNKLLVQVVANFSHSVEATQYIGAIFNTDVHSTNAGAVGVGFPSNAGTYKATQVVINYFLTAPTTSATTFRFRAGGQQAGTLVLNGGFGDANRKMGGAFSSSITITEIQP